MNLSIFGDSVKQTYRNGRRNKRESCRSVTGSHAIVMKWSSVSMKVKRGLGNRILLPTLTHGSDLDVEYGAAVELSY